MRLLVGRKPTTAYVLYGLAAARGGELKVAARGRLISKAVDVALRLAALTDLEVKSVEIGTVERMDGDVPRRVSTIEITLARRGS